MKYWTEADILSKRIRKKNYCTASNIVNAKSHNINFSSKKKKYCKINNIQISNKKNGIIMNQFKQNTHKLENRV